MIIHFLYKYLINIIDSKLYCMFVVINCVNGIKYHVICHFSFVT